MKGNVSGRRQFLVGSAALAATAVMTPLDVALAAMPTRDLSVEHLTTGERVTVTYLQRGRFDAEALALLDHLMRDWRQEKEIHIDRRVYDLLNVLSYQLPCKGPISIISGYRTVKTNEMLRRNGRGAAKNSLHLHGMAVDFRLPGVKLSEVRRAAALLKAGGVGYYPRSNFVHIDTGPVRYW